MRSPAGISRLADVDRKQLKLALLTAGGIGFLPRGAATAATLAGAGAFLLMRPSLPSRLALAAAAVSAGQLTANCATSQENRDPDFVVIDEVAGIWLTLLPVSPTPLHCTLGAVMFRLLDRFKPGPVGRVDRSGGRWSLMADDMIAGSMAALLVRVVTLIGERADS